MKITLNLSPSRAVPPGDYLVEVARVTLRDKNDGSSQYLHFDLTIVEGRHEGEALDTIASLRPEMAQLLPRTFAAFGIDGPEIEIDYDEEVVKRTSWGDEVERVVTKPDMTGKRVVASVVHREVGDEIYPRVRP